MNKITLQIGMLAWKNLHIIAIACCVVIAAGIIGLGIADGVIYNQGKEKTSRSKDCPELPKNVTKFKLDKVFLYGWHRKYHFNNYPVHATVQQNCPSATNDAIIFMNGHRVAQTDGKIASTKSKTYIKDCHGDILYTTKIAKLPWEIVLNSITLKISFEVSDHHGNLLAYVAGSSFWKTSMDLTDVYGNKIATVTKDDPFTFSNWEVEIYNLTSPATDSRILTLVAGKQAFTEENGNDTCNGFFWDVVWIIIAAVGVILLTTGTFLWKHRLAVKNWFRHVRNQSTETVGLPL